MVQGAKAAASMRHSKVTAVALSVPVNRNVAVVCSVGLTGPAVTKVFGGTWSAGGGVLPSHTML